MDKSQKIYYEVGDLVVHNQLEAALLDHTTRNGRKFYFYEKEFDGIDWTREPAQTYDNLALQRALQIRSRYKHLCLLFSGGSDSSDVLRIFLENNIPIDELIIFNHKYNPKWRWETENHKIPLAQWYCQQQPGMKCTVYDINDTMYRDDYRTADWLEESGRMTAQMGMNSYVFSRLLQKFRDFRNTPDVGYMYGLEKARVWIENNNWYMRQIDKIFEFTDLLASPTLEFFYLAPDLPEFYVKQCWMLIRHLENKYTDIDQTFVENLYRSSHPLYQDLVEASGRKLYQPTINKTPAFMCNGGNKASNQRHDYSNIALRVQAAKEKWHALSQWQDNMQDLSRNYNFLFNQNDPMMGLIGTWGKSYYIKPVEPKQLNI
jgi:hypothetical protein